MLILVAAIVILAYSLVASRLSRWGVPGPMIIAVAGALFVLTDVSGFAESIDGETALHVVELLLAVLLFVDACEVKGGIFGTEGRMLSRLVLLALPLSIVLVVLVGGVLLPDMNAFVLIVVACVIMPTDFAPATVLLRSDRIPARVRQILNVESGYNDGVISPVFGMSLAIAVAAPSLLDPSTGADGTVLTAPGSSAGQDDFWVALAGAVPATVFAIGIGIVLGGTVGFLTRWAVQRQLASVTGIRFVVLLTPLLAFGLATLHGIDANGFVTAFTAGVVFRFARTRHTDHQAVPHDEVTLVDEVGTLASYLVWFVLGAMATYIVIIGVEWRLVLLAALALTVLRMLPVYLALIRTPLGWRDRTLIGLIGPRGTASIVFGLLAFNKLPDTFGDPVLTLTVLTVVGSILLQGLIVPYFLSPRTGDGARRLSRSPR